MATGAPHNAEIPGPAARDGNSRGAMDGCGRTASAAGIPCTGLHARMSKAFGHGPSGLSSGPSMLPLQKRSGYSLLRATIAGLRTHAPAAFPVVVRSGANVPPDTDAYCSRRHSRFVIMLGQHLAPKDAVEAVIHEWAHARAWSHMHDRAVADMQAGRIDAAEFEVLVHDGTWGIEFAFCWRVFTGRVLPGFDHAAA